MDKLNDVLAMLDGITEEATIEEARRVILDVAELCRSIIDDVAAMRTLINELTAANTDKDYEIARLKEENGRIYRDRAEQIMRNVEDKAAEITGDTDDEAALLENIDI